MRPTGNNERKPTVFSLLTLATCLSAAASPASAAAFGPATTLAARPTQVLASSAIDAAGDALVAWEEAGAATYHQKAKYRPAGGTWSDPVSIGPPSQQGAAPAMQFKPSGGVVAVSSDGTAIYTTDMTAAGLWARPRKLLAVASFPLLATNQAGDEAVVASLTAIRRPANATAWAKPETIPTPPTGQFQQIDAISLGPDGDLIVPIEATDEECDRVGCQFTVTLYVARETTPGAGWTISAPLAGPFTSTGYIYFSVPVEDSKRHAAILFQNGNSVTAQSNRAGTWSSPVPVFSNLNATALYLVGAATNTNGAASVAVSERATNFQNIVIDGNLATNIWQTPTIVSQADPNAGITDLYAANPNGGTALAWSDPDGTIRIASRLRPNSPWRALQIANPADCNNGFTGCTIADTVSINNGGQEVAAWTTQATQGFDVPVKVKAATTK